MREISSSTAVVMTIASEGNAGTLKHLLRFKGYLSLLCYEHMPALADNQGSCPLWCLPQASYSSEAGHTEANGPTNFPHSIPTW